MYSPGSHILIIAQTLKTLDFLLKGFFPIQLFYRHETRVNESIFCRKNMFFLTKIGLITSGLMSIK
jgi:hypothetical protein